MRRGTGKSTHITKHGTSGGSWCLGIPGQTPSPGAQPRAGTHAAVLQHGAGWEIHMVLLQGWEFRQEKQVYK